MLYMVQTNIWIDILEGRNTVDDIPNLLARVDE